MEQFGAIMNNNCVVEDEEDFEEAAYWHILYGFCMLVLEYGSDKVIMDLQKVQKSFSVEH